MSVDNNARLALAENRRKLQQMYEDDQKKFELIETITVGYAVTTEQPVDWETNYVNYYTRTGNAVNGYTYTAVTSGTAPVWKAGTYYTTADVTSLVRTQEPDGTLYNFEKVFIYFIAPSGGENASLGYAQMTANQTYCATYAIVATTVRYAKILVDITSGLMLSRCSYGTNPASMGGVTERLNPVTLSGTPISRLTMNPTTPSVYLPGSRIEIYAIRK